MTCISEAGQAFVLFGKCLRFRQQIMEPDFGCFCLRQRGVCVGGTADGFMDSCGWVKLEKQEIIHLSKQMFAIVPVSAAHCASRYCQSVFHRPTFTHV